MRIVSLVIVSLVVGAALAATVVSVPASALTINWDTPPAAVPEVAATDRDGGSISTTDLRGRVIVLNLWATWCAPCRREMPTLAALQDAFSPSDVEVVALAIDRAPFAELDAFMAEVGASNLTVLQNSDMAVARALGAQGLPLTLVIDAAGRERFRHAGYADWGQDDVVRQLRQLASD